MTERARRSARIGLAGRSASISAVMRDAGPPGSTSSGPPMMDPCDRHVNTSADLSQTIPTTLDRPRRRRQIRRHMIESTPPLSIQLMPIVKARARQIIDKGSLYINHKNGDITPNRHLYLRHYSISVNINRECPPAGGRRSKIYNKTMADHCRQQDRRRKHPGTALPDAIKTSNPSSSICMPLYNR